MPHHDDNPGNYPIPPNEGYVIPNDAVATPNNGGSGPAETITGEAAVNLLVAYAEQLLTQNNIFTPQIREFYPREVEPGSVLMSSLYSTVIDTPGSAIVTEGYASLKNVLEQFKGVAGRDSEVRHMLNQAFGDNKYLESTAPEKHSPINANDSSNAIQEFVNSAVTNQTTRDTLGFSSNPLLTHGNDVTLNATYRKQVIGDTHSALGAEQVYSTERTFATSMLGEWTSDFSEIAGAGTSQATAGAALTTIDISGINGSNAVVNFYGGIAREFHRNPEKLVKFIANNVILHAQNPAVVNADSESLKSYTTNAVIKNLFTKVAGAADDGPVRGNVEAIYRRTGPSILSLIPDVQSFAFYGRGKFFNPLSLAGGGSLTFGEQIIPGMGRNLDGVEPFTGLVLPIQESTSDFRDKEKLEPYSAIAKVENPAYLTGKKGKRVLSSIGQNRWQLRNLPDINILRPVDINSETSLFPEGNKPYATNKDGNKLTGIDVAAIEQALEAEYVPFYFHDLRTNEIIAFHAFLRNLTETFAPSWNAEPYYGRVDNVQIYSGNTKRDIGLSFTIASLNKIDFDIMWKKVNKLVTLVYPQYSEPINNGKSAIPFSESIRGAPIIRMRLGDLIKTNFSLRAVDVSNSNIADFTIENDLFADLAGTLDTSLPGAKKIKMLKTMTADFNTFGKGLPGIINDLAFDYSAARWETAQGHVAPQIIEVTLSFTAIHDIPPGLRVDGVNRAPLYTPVKEQTKDIGKGFIPPGDAIFFQSQGDGTLNTTLSNTDALT